MTTTTRTLETAIAYVDAQDPSDLAWAYRLTYDDGHQESGPMDTDIGDESGAILDELRELVGDAWEAGRWEYCDAEHGSYVWRAASTGSGTTPPPRAGRRPMTETTPDGPTYPVVINTALLEEHGACSEGLAAFLAACPSGELVIPDAAAHAAALSGPLAEWEWWAITAGILPRLAVAAGDGGTVTAGYAGSAAAGEEGFAKAGKWGIAVAGSDGGAIAGDQGIAVAGDWGAATAGDQGIAVVSSWGDAMAGHEGIAVAGFESNATAGYCGSAIAGRDGTVKAGRWGTLIVRWWDARAGRSRFAVAYVGEHAPGLPDGEVIQPDVPYRVEVVGDRPMWRRAEAPRG